MSHEAMVPRRSTARPAPRFFVDAHALARRLSALTATIADLEQQARNLAIGPRTGGTSWGSGSARPDGFGPKRPLVEPQRFAATSWKPGDWAGAEVFATSSSQDLGGGTTVDAAPERALLLRCRHLRLRRRRRRRGRRGRHVRVPERAAIRAVRPVCRVIRVLHDGSMVVCGVSLAHRRFLSLRALWFCATCPLDDGPVVSCKRRVRFSTTPVGKPGPAGPSPTASCCGTGT